LYMIIPLFMLILFLINKFDKTDFYVYLTWSLIVLFSFLIKGYSLLGLLSSFTTSIPLLILAIFGVDYILIKKNALGIKEKIYGKIPLRLVSVGITIFAGLILMSIISGPYFIIDRLRDVAEHFIHPMGTSRFVLTVAEARQPYFVDWLSSFRKFFYVFFIGSIYLFYQMIKNLGRIKWYLNGVYTLFISGFIFSRYSQSAKLFTGETFISNFVYLGSFIMFILILFLVYLISFYKNKELYSKIKQINRNYAFIFIWFLLMVVAARGAMRLFLVFCPIVAILGSNFIVVIYDYSIKNQTLYKKLIGLAVVILILIAPVQGSLFWFAKTTSNAAKYTGPSFDDQWQTTMSWVKENIPEDAVFAHWWDYGYWVQTMWERATVLDGGNAISYWNHLMGRHVLTGKSSTEALEFLKTHDVTHLLIIADEIGKYPAYASIGSDKDYDRLSYIPTFRADPQEVQETREGYNYLFRGQFVFDKDFVYQGKLILRNGAMIAGFILPINQEGNIAQPTVVVGTNQGRVDIPLNCVAVNGQEFNYETPGGLNGCLILIPSINSQNQINPIEIALYVSPKTRNTLFTQMYLLGKEWPGFKLVYDDSDNWPLIYASHLGRLFGPFKIWEIEYPQEIKANPEYLKTSYPSQDIVESGQQFL